MQHGRLGAMSTGEITAIERQLIRYAGVKSPAEISELTGIPSEDVARRITEVLESVDILTIQQKRAKLILALEQMADEVTSRLADLSDRNLAANINASAGAMGRVLKELRESEKSAKVDVLAITQHQGRVLGEIVDIAMGHLRDELKARYGADDDEMDVLVAEGVVKGVSELESRVSE